ncbi:hypothetical protein HPB51_014188 [Rhipicephalus microplus]|uniref:Uncharacterized protein n=1 Tax=Rhipicephalus microplus TaxID=6941 RepID=A0A9J6E259_RHIMP|nr:hypothetical protein HPB51_014188 [Rhipicephalus microplus]
MLCTEGFNSADRRRRRSFSSPDLGISGWKKQSLTNEERETRAIQTAQASSPGALRICSVLPSDVSSRSKRARADRDETRAHPAVRETHRRMKRKKAPPRVCGRKWAFSRLPLPLFPPSSLLGQRKANDHAVMASEIAAGAQSRLRAGGGKDRQCEETRRQSRAGLSRKSALSGGSRGNPARMDRKASASPILCQRRRRRRDATPGQRA